MRTGLISVGFFALALLEPTAMAAASPALLFEATSGKVLYAEDVDNLWHPASLTKIMTASITFEAIRDGILADVSAFSGDAIQFDDMALVNVERQAV